MTFRRPKSKSARKTSENARPSWAPAAQPVPFGVDRARELETENSLLRARVVELTSRVDDLLAERANFGTAPTRPTPGRGGTPIGYSAAVPWPGPGGVAGGVVDLDDLDTDDGSVEAFEEFLSIDDPHLDKVRRFLLD